MKKSMLLITLLMLISTIAYAQFPEKILPITKETDTFFDVQLTYFNVCYGVGDLSTTYYIRSKRNAPEWNNATEYIVKRPALAITLKLAICVGLNTFMHEIYNVSPLAAHIAMAILNVGVTALMYNNLSLCVAL